MAESFTARGVDKAHAAIMSIMVARSSQQVDHWTQKHATDDCMATQIDPKDPALAGMIASGHAYPLFARCDYYHFDPANGWPVVERLWLEVQACLDRGELPSDALLMALGVALHNAFDTSGPHAGYTGRPSKANYILARKRLRERGEDLPVWSRLLGKKVFIGHMADPEADRIEHCRDGAQRSANRLFCLVSGGSVDSHEYATVDGTGKGEVQSIIAVQKAHNDHDLALRQRRIFADVTGQELPEWVPFSGLELATWKGCVGGA
jgi:hypothetical protein